MDLDLEAVEKLVKKDKKSKDEKKKKHKKHRSGSRSRSRSEDRQKHKSKAKRSRSTSEDRKKDKSKKHKKEKEKRSKTRSESKDHKRRSSPKKKRESSEKKSKTIVATTAVVKETHEEAPPEKTPIDSVALLKQRLEEKHREEEEARREDNTVTVTSLSLKASEKEIYGFFNQCGKIRDIKIIRDPRSFRSRGIAYVEFFYSDAVANALNMTNKEFLGYKIQVTPSFAEKNRAAQAAKKMNKVTNNTAPQLNIAGGKHLKVVYVASLNETIGEITEKALKDLFDPFGEIEQVDIHRDPISGRPRGFAFIHYVRQDDAKEAIKKMNGFLIKDHPLTVSNVPYNMSVLVNNTVDMDDENGGFLRSAEARTLLIHKFSMSGQTPAAHGVDALLQQRNDVSSVPTPIVMLSNLVTNTETEMMSDPRYFKEIQEEVQTECSKYGTVENVLIESTSEGNIWVKFSSIKEAKAACDKLNNRNFNGRQILCSFAKEEGYMRRIYPIQ